MRDGDVASIFQREGEHWLPQPEAGGPFGGLHGGAVSGLLVAEMERAAHDAQMGVMLSVSVLFLRPAPMAPLEVESRILRQGDRVGAIETELRAKDKLVAKAHASFVAALAADALPEEPARPFDPTPLPPWLLEPRFPHPTLFDVLDLRVDGTGIKWGRLLRPILTLPSTLAHVCAVADNGQPFSLRDPGTIVGRYAFPNIDLAIHVARPPVGPWVGVDARSDWRKSGMGLTESALYDEQGRFGRACQSIVLVPRT
jgi:acyl-CoA thioesterase